MGDIQHKAAGAVEDRERLYSCEQCGKPIYIGDKFQPAGDCDFCPDHAATLGDILKQWESDIAEPIERAFWTEEFDSLEAVQKHIEELRERVAREGADFKPLFEA